MANDPATTTVDTLRHLDFSARALADLTSAEKAELERRFDNFVRHFRSGKRKAPLGAKPKQIRKWHP